MNKVFFKRLAYSGAGVSLSAIMMACGGGSNRVDTSTPEPVANTCPNVGNLIPIELAANQCQISGELIESGTLSSQQTWFLEGGFQIGNISNKLTGANFAVTGESINPNSAAGYDYYAFTLHAITTAIPFTKGETVKVIDGPFNGFDGTIEKINEEILNNVVD